MRAADIIYRAVEDAFDYGRGPHSTADEVVRALDRDGWKLVRVKQTVTEEPSEYPFSDYRVDRLAVEIEGEGIFDVSTRTTKSLLEQTVDPKRVLQWGLQDRIATLAMEVAKKVGWFE